MHLLVMEAGAVKDRVGKMDGGLQGGVGLRGPRPGQEHAGEDPKKEKLLWHILAKVGQKTLILLSHSPIV